MSWLKRKIVIRYILAAAQNFLGEDGLESPALERERYCDALTGVPPKRIYIDAAQQVGETKSLAWI